MDDNVIIWIISAVAVAVGMLQYSKTLIQSNDKDRKQHSNEVSELQKMIVRLEKERNQAVLLAKNCKHKYKSQARYWQLRAQQEYEFNQRILSVVLTDSVNADKLRETVQTEAITDGTNTTLRNSD